MELEKIQQLYDEDIYENQLKILNEQIVEASRTESSLSFEALKLKKKIEHLNETLVELEAENERLGEAYVEPSTNFSKILKNGTFFQQLRALDSVEERLTNQISGLQIIKRNLSDDIKAGSARLQTFQKQHESLISEIEDLNAKNLHYSTELLRLESKSIELSEQRMTLYENAENTKAKINNASQYSQSESSINSVDLRNLHASLVKELSNLQEELIQSQKKEKSILTASQAQEALLNKKVAIESSPSKWISQRTSLVSKIRKARQELALLETRERSSNRINSIASSSISDEDARIAIFLELQDMKKKNNNFLKYSIETENNYAQQLMQKIEEIDKITSELSSFKEETDKLLKEQEEQADRQNYLSLLKADLEEIRRKN